MGLAAAEVRLEFDDGVRDDLVGGPGVDWYLGALPDVLHGRRPNEQIN